MRNRRMLRRAVVGVTGVLALTVAPATPAALATTPESSPAESPRAAEPSSQQGVEKLAFSSSGMELELGNQNFAIPLTGTVIMEGTPPVVPGSTTAIDVRNLTAHSISPDHSSAPRQATAAQQGLGEVHVEQSSTPKASLTMSQKFPPKFEQTVFLDLNITIENPPEGLRERVAPRSAPQEPLVLTTKNPAEMLGKLDNFPPQGAQYQLQNPIELATENSQETVGHVLGIPAEIDVL
ncbi:hypothetical protein [Actinopolyspora saharensis]|uniref:hypothetical protein n=1 Tax=Actinopolyspora saharensis TaxID=995062 RepID=UPI001113D578|nr:hypothetical protein [Actinopolyspora saharensis]